MPARSPLRVLVGSAASGVVAGPAAERVGGGWQPAGVILLDLGADHPSRAGLLELKIWLAEDLAADDRPQIDQQPIERAEVIVGAMHRGAEKLYEVRDYRQILMLADRHDWQAPAAAELAIALACERLLGLETPARAQWLRTLLAEHNRILSHLGFLGYLLRRGPAPSPVPGLRERLRHQLQRWTGNRVHPMINRLGGLAADVDDSWLIDEAELAEAAVAVADRAAELIMEPALAQASARMPRLTAELVDGYGVTGPAARAAGVDLDLRRQQPYLCYAELDGELGDDADAVRADGSVLATFATMINELRSSARMIITVAERVRDLAGPVGVRLGKIVKLPEGEIYLATEAPLGQAGCYLVSRGEKTPWRLKLRTPSFNNVAALEALLPGCRVGDLELMLAAHGYVIGDIDK
ncbi:NADH-quinone oxidoreductase subunit D [Microlunatus elymi]|uniref:NADH-quinone oxidoreductase subunit D n=1 Tax=Microlunatus elymi TaxID=2596828 RepID=A0A516PVQ2_9ACTN|nr:NADH-quinone oxidoreductase subunit D [Microlunatus elymi]QDP95202.1 NADH-quinone oxidoreductase subunit D [Microlunatus elymi]